MLSLFAGMLKSHEAMADILEKGRGTQEDYRAQKNNSRNIKKEANKGEQLQRTRLV